MTFISRTPRWLPLAVVALVLYAIVTLVVQLRGHDPAQQDRAAKAKADAAADRLISQALGQIPGSSVDSTAIKQGWRDDVPGIDLAAMPAERREIMLRAANSQQCTCGCGYTLAACRTYDTTCPVSGPRVSALRDSVNAGLVVAEGLRQRPERAPTR